MNSRPVSLIFDGHRADAEKAADHLRRLADGLESGDIQDVLVTAIRSDGKVESSTDWPRNGHRD